MHRDPVTHSQSPRRLASSDISPDAVSALGYETALKFLVMPMRIETNRLFVAMAHILSDTCNHIEMLTGMKVSPVLCNEFDLREQIGKFYGIMAIHHEESRFLVNRRPDVSSESMWSSLEVTSAPTVTFIDTLIEHAVLRGASDIHIEPQESSLRIRLREGGRLRTHAVVDRGLAQNAVSRVKVVAGMDIAQRRTSQDGRFSIVTSVGKVELRVSSLPTSHGEKVAIRLLYGNVTAKSTSDLGISDSDIEGIRRMFEMPYGAVVATGPTGSGKSTTMRAFLSEINHEHSNIVSIEDPVENPLPGVNHVNVDVSAGFCFASALRHILRQDPDIIAVGEVRDSETALLVVQAALTGHLVLSTLHANDAAGVVTRLIDLGVPHFLIADVLNGVISQRLLRGICPHCKTAAVLTHRQAVMLGIDRDYPAFVGVGCGKCDHSGFSSRFAIVDYFSMNDDRREWLHKDHHDFVQHIRSTGGLPKFARNAFLEGRTTAEEVLHLSARNPL